MALALATQEPTEEEQEQAAEKKTEQEHPVTMPVSTPSPFCMKSIGLTPLDSQLTHTDGPSTSRAVLLAEKKQPTNFTDLPPELRVKIYDYSLREEDSILIEETSIGERPRVKCGCVPAYVDRRSIPWNNFNILRVNKQVHQEASPIAYSCEFLFDDFVTMADFLELIGSMRQLIRRLWIEDLIHLNPYYYGMRGKCLQYLREMDNFRITIHTPVEMGFDSVDEFEEALDKDWREDWENEARESD